MRKLYYATFEKGYEEIVPKFVRSLDKNSHIKKLYADSVIFYAAENFKFSSSIFMKAYAVFAEVKKEGVGAVNASMKHLLEQKNLRISLPASVKKFRLTIAKSSDKVLVDQKLKSALETMLAKTTKKQVGYFGADAELILLCKPDGECLLMRDITAPSEFAKLADSLGRFPTAELVMNFLSEPAEREVSLDPFASDGVISFTRALVFKRANVIANEHDEAKIPGIKKLAKSLRERAFSVMEYDFLSPVFPIHFIDKIVTNLSSDAEVMQRFFDKAFTLKVKLVVIKTTAKNIDKFVKDRFEIRDVLSVGRETIFVLSFVK